MKATAISGFGCKGPAAFLIEADGRRLLLDLGEGPDQGRRPDLAGLGRLDAVVISHGHRDHIGALNELAAIGNPPVFATAPVRALAREPALRAAVDLPLQGVCEIAGLTLRTGRDGHAPGGVWLRIDCGGGLVYTGDLSRESRLYPYDPPLSAAAMIFDASYGAYDGSLAAAAEQLDALARAAPLLLPAPAGGRGLEMAIEFGRKRDLRLALCPAHLEAARTLLDSPSATLTQDGRTELGETMARARRLCADDEPQGMMIAASADADGGLAAELARRWRDRCDVEIVFTGHIPTGSRAQALRAEGRARFIRWNVHPRLSDIRALFDLVRPAVAMPAFLDEDQLPNFHNALADPRLALSKTIAW